MMADHTEPVDGKPRKRVAGKAAVRADGKKLKTTIHLSVEASKKLAVHAAYMSLDRSALVEKLIVEHLRRYIVSDRGGSADAGGEDAAA